MIEQNPKNDDKNHKMTKRCSKMTDKNHKTTNENKKWLSTVAK
jgi:hypothetical protein